MYWKPEYHWIYKKMTAYYKIFELLTKGLHDGKMWTHLFFNTGSRLIRVNKIQTCDSGLYEPTIGLQGSRNEWIIALQLHKSWKNSLLKLSPSIENVCFFAIIPNLLEKISLALVKGTSAMQTSLDGTQDEVLPAALKGLTLTAARRPKQQLHQSLICVIAIKSTQLVETILANVCPKE